MIYCLSCNSLNVEVLETNFYSEKVGDDVSKELKIPNKEFYCQNCSNAWYSDPVAYKLYMEYLELIPRTTLIAQTIKSGGSYTVQHIDYEGLVRRKELAKILSEKYKSYLDVNPGEWYEIERDARF